MSNKKDSYQSKIEEYHDWNFSLNAASGGFGNMGMALVGYTTVLPAFLTLFTKSNFVVGLRFFVGTSFGVLASFVVKGVLEKYEYPVNFSLIFLLAFSMLLLSIVFLAISKEPLISSKPRRKSFSEHFSRLGNIMKSDRTFAWFTVSIIVRSFGVTIMGVVFYTVYAIRELHVSIDQAGTFMGIMLAAQLVGSLFLGRVCDLRGSKLVQILNRAFELLSIGAILLHPDIIGVYIAFGIFGLVSASMAISYHTMVIELAPSDRVDTYLGLINGIRAPSLAIAPLVGGFLADRFSYESVFVAAFLGSLASGVILFLKVKLPRFASMDRCSTPAIKG